MVLWDADATVLSGVWNPETLGDWLNGANIPLSQYTGILLYKIPVSVAFLCMAALLCLLGSTSKG